MNNKNKINNIEIDNKLNFRFTKFIYFIGLFMMFLGYVVVFLINANDMNFQKNNFQIVIWIFNLVSTLILAVNFYFEKKDLDIIKVILKTKHLRHYYYTQLVYICNILINFIIYLLISTYLTKIETVNSYLILLVCVGIIGIVSYAYYRFIIIQIELTIAKKKYTDNAKNEIVKDEQTKNQPTSGIANK